MSHILTAWSKVTEDLISKSKEDRSSDFVTHANKLIDTQTLLFFGYITNEHDETGKGIMQSKIVNELVPDDHLDKDKERQKRRQDIKRRADALIFFSAIERIELTPVAVEFVLTLEGEALYDDFNQVFNSLWRKG